LPLGRGRIEDEGRRGGGGGSGGGGPYRGRRRSVIVTGLDVPQKNGGGRCHGISSRCVLRAMTTVPPFRRLPLLLFDHHLEVLVGIGLLRHGEQRGEKRKRNGRHMMCHH
jgi:hypothetical protein